MNWYLITVSLPGKQSSLRMRLWRSFRQLGAAALRDGVYLLPARAPLLAAVEELQVEIAGTEGSLLVFAADPLLFMETEELETLFQRGEEFEALQQQARQVCARLQDTQPGAAEETRLRREIRQLQREFEQLVEVDFFPDAAQARTRATLEELENSLNRAVAPDEPAAEARPLARLEKAEYQGRLWATRARLWVDRLACAWLIRRFIDPRARFLWLKDIANCPAEALGFDFQGAAFTHVNDYVSFEVLMRSFGLEADAALAQVAGIVHVLDVGGARSPEAAGLETILGGARENYQDDDALLDALVPVFDALYSAMQQNSCREKENP